MVEYKNRAFLSGVADDTSYRIQHLNKLLGFLGRVVSCYVYDDGGAGGGKVAKSKDLQCSSNERVGGADDLPLQGDDCHGKKQVARRQGKDHTDGNRDASMQGGQECVSAVAACPAGMGQKAMVRRLISTLRSRFGLDQAICTLLELEAECWQSGHPQETGQRCKEGSEDLEQEEGGKEKAKRKEKKQKEGQGKAAAGAACPESDKNMAKKVEGGMGASANGGESSQDDQRGGTGARSPGFAKKLGTFTNRVRGHVGADGRIQLDKLFNSNLPVRSTSGARACLLRPVVI